MPTRAERSAARAFARLYCPPAQQAALGTLLGIEAEIRAGLAPGVDHQVAHTRLGWWREECLRLEAGTPLHPLTQALTAQFAHPERAVLAGVGGLVDLAIWDLAQATFGSRRELEAYCERWSTALVAPLSQLALPQSPPPVALGARLKELELLNGLGADARAGRVRLPLDELTAAQVPPQALTAGTWSAELSALVRAAHTRARAQLAGAVAAPTPAQQAPLRALLVWAEIVAADSRRLSAALPRAALPGDHPALLDGWRAWRAARRAERGRFGLPLYE
jgi:phytoene synthase